jgi:hypothetical protein
MRTKVLGIFVVAVAGIAAGWMLFRRQPSADGFDRTGFDRTQNTLPALTRNVLDSGEQFVLLSLDPTPLALRRQFGRESDPPPKETFHDYAVLGKAAIHDQKERAELLRALYKGVADSHGLVASCFNPRHGISATLAGETVDLVICFECLSIQTYAKDGKGVLTTASPQPTFNRALGRAGLPLASDK